jgi:SAM-dependent methyltransferase
VLVPRRRRGFEFLDDPTCGATLRERSLRDVRRANTLLGGTWAVLGGGLGYIPVGARRPAPPRQVRLTTFGLDEAASLARVSAGLLDASVCGDARRLPFADASVDLVTCSQVLHHFEDREIPAILRELSRVARLAVIVSDLRRSWLAAAGFWMATWPMGFHPVSRHDGLTSVLRGFTPTELERHVQEIGQAPAVRRHLGFRVTATWSPTSSPTSA